MWVRLLVSKGDHFAIVGQRQCKVTLQKEIVNQFQFILTFRELSDLPPSMRVRFILGEDADKPGQNEPRPVFSEMEEFKSENGTDGEWKEVAR